MLLSKRLFRIASEVPETDVAFLIPMISHPIAFLSLPGAPRHRVPSFRTRGGLRCQTMKISRQSIQPW